MTWTRRLGDEDGHSLFSSLFGLLMFLVLLLFAVQVTTHLHATTVVTTAAFDAARLVSGSRSIAPGEGVVELQCVRPSQAEVDRADAHLAQLLGALWANGGASDWGASTADRVEVTVTVQTPARVVGGIGAIPALSRITRTVSLARECVR